MKEEVLVLVNCSILFSLYFNYGGLVTDDPDKVCVERGPLFECFNFRANSAEECDPRVVSGSLPCIRIRN